MQTHRPHRGPRVPALLGGFVAVWAGVLFAATLPLHADATTAPHRSPALPSASDGPPAAPEQAFHRVTTAAAGAAVRLNHLGACLPVPIQPTAVGRCDVRPRDSFGVTSPASGPPFRVLFCTWLN